MANDHAIRVIHGLVIPELYSNEEVAVGGFANFSFKTLQGECGEIPRDSLVIHAPARHRVNMTEDELVLDR